MLISQAFSPSEKSSWTASFERLRSLIISYCGMTLEDPSMFPQPSDKPTGPAEFLPLLLSLTPSTSPSGDLLTSTASTPSARGPLLPDEVLPFIGDLGANFDRDTLADVITPTLSLFFQEWFKLSPTPDIMGNEWRRYLGAVATLVQVKQIAALVRSQSHSRLTSASLSTCVGGTRGHRATCRVAVSPRSSDPPERVSQRICELSTEGQR